MPNPTELELKQSLLLIQGVIYAELPESVSFYVYPDQSVSFEHSWAVPWRQDIDLTTPATSLIPPVVLPASGTMTDNAPIDIIGQTAGTAFVGPSGMEWHEQCMAILMRRI
ncbi:MAG: hypothetical protein J0652_02570 [Desulfobulbaceae bacterium]|nr:hypothetical protein [Desulfobulbaceae bacterium]